ncbi:MAG: hypothetical protein Q8L27_01495 [archaeon]|nr:hypothetical protein [archaeon]
MVLNDRLKSEDLSSVKKSTENNNSRYVEVGTNISFTEKQHVHDLPPLRAFNFDGTNYLFKDGKLIFRARNSGELVNYMQNWEVKSAKSLL